MSTESSRRCSIDVNCTIIFEEPGITTHSVGQIDTSTLRSFSAAAELFDLFVEDELHELDANLKALYVALELMVGCAWIVIEDINPAVKQTWLAIAKYLEIDFCCWVIRANVSILFLAQRRLV